MPAILISDFVKATLEKMKAKEEHKSLDSVIRSLLYERDKVRELNAYTLAYNRKGIVKEAKK